MTKNQANGLAKALKKEFGGKVELEAVDEAGRYRFAVTSKRFDTMAHLARQDAIWKLVDQVLPAEATLDVSIVLAYAPADLAGVK